MRSERHSDRADRTHLCFLGSPRLTQMVRLVLHEYEEVATIEVVEAAFGSALKWARQRESDGGTDAFVTAGANGALLRSALSSPVAIVKVTGYDILQALIRAREIGVRVAVITHSETIPELDAARDLLKIDISQRAYRTLADMRNWVESIAREHCDVVVGSTVVVDLAEKRGLSGVLAYSMASIRQSIEDAIELARVARLEAARFDQLDGVLRHLQEAVLAVDASNRIIAVNPPMEKLLGRDRKALISAVLDDVAPMLSLRSVLEFGLEERAQVVQLARREWLMNRAPILERGKTSGAIVTLYDANTIREGDARLRAQRNNQRPHAARYSFNDLQGKSPRFVRARETAMRFAKTDLTVLLSGESGTGKELFAQAMHNESARADGPFVAANCAAFPESLLESELFGYEEGAFTGTRKGGKRGLFETAHSGTLFLDEIGDMPLSLQTRLLRVLQEREVMRLGGTIPVPVDVRVMAASHRPLGLMVHEGHFRADLFYRINILGLKLPPLRERDADIVPMAHMILGRCLRKLGVALSPEALLEPLWPRLRAYDWPGNLRELENICERMAVFFAQYDTLAAIPYELLELDCPELFRRSAAGASQISKTTITQVLEQCRGNRAEAARRLGVSRATLWRRIRSS